jgi:Fic family protein
LKLSFDAHYDLVSIHPFGDGNGRTSRLLMNFIQHYHQLPIAPVFREDRADYIEAMTQSREEKSMEPFYEFMGGQYLKYLKSEIAKYQSRQNEGISKDKSGEDYSLVF